MELWSNGRRAAVLQARRRSLTIELEVMSDGDE
jgi:hypothetical protein